MYKKIFKVSLIFIILLVSGCNNSNSIIGTWSSFENKNMKDDIYYKFNKNNTGEYGYYGNVKPFEYEDRGTKIVVKYKDSTSSNEYDYYIENDILTIKDSFNSSVIYKRK